MSTPEMTYAAFEKRFEKRQFIGSGGFSKVYKVFDHDQKYFVALKVADVNPEWKQFTLQREVELVNRLPYHRNIARYEACYRFNAGLAGEMDFALLKYYENGNLEQFLANHTLSVPEIQLLAHSILQGIQFLHDHHVIHRDLKVQNILLSREDGVWNPKITDFGLSRQTNGDSSYKNSQVAVSLAYAAPEQLLVKRIHKNVDLWAFGVILFRIMTGALPFESAGSAQNSSASRLAISQKIINLELPPSLNAIPEPFQTAIRQCLVRRPEDRVQSAGALIDLLTKDPLPNIARNLPGDPNPSRDQRAEGASGLNVDGPAFEGVNHRAATTFLPDSNPTILPKDQWPQPPATHKATASSPEPPQNRLHRKIFWWWVIIAFLLALAAGGTYYFSQVPPESEPLYWEDKVVDPE